MRWPPINSIVVFEAVGRHESLLKAAAELKVTPGAVSRQIKQLEQSVGTDLFVRSHRKVTLTENGRSYWRAVNGITEQLRYETERLIRHKKPPELRVSCSITFLQHWMLSRFLHFKPPFPS